MVIINTTFEKFNAENLCKTPNPRFHLMQPLPDVANAILSAYHGEVKARGCNFDEKNADDTISKIDTVASWITNDKGRMGLLLYGNVGTGKTTLLRAVCNVINYTCKPEYGELTLNDAYRKCIDIVRAKDVVEAYQNDKDLYNRMLKVDLLAIDEFGVEAIDVKSYGNSNEPIIDLLSTRYDRQRCTLVSSNLDLDQISQRYGLRLQDRFVEMFKMVSFNGKSFRK